METNVINKANIQYFQNIEFIEHAEGVTNLMQSLTKSNNYQIHTYLRQHLIRMGTLILPQLHNLILSKNAKLRQETSKVIASIGNKDSIPILIRLLEDSEGSIRWIAAEGLIHIGRDSIVPILKSLIQSVDDLYLKLGARYIFLQLFDTSEKKYFKRFLLSLKSNNYFSILAPIEAYQALLMFKYA